MNIFPSRPKAFALIELIIVIVVIAVLAYAVSVSVGSNKLAGAASKLMFDLRFAQRQAMSRQVTCGVSFDPAGNSYFVYIGDTSTIATNPHTGGNFSVDYDTDTEYKGITITSTNFGDDISFDYIGTPYDSTPDVLSSAGTVIIQEGTNSRTITIEPNTGYIFIP